jgi:hypothetical protein
LTGFGFGFGFGLLPLTGTRATIYDEARSSRISLTPAVVRLDPEL